jgi:hypothetical protein
MNEHFGRFFQFFSILSDLKCNRSAFSSFTNHLGTLTTTEQHTRNSWGDQALLVFGGLFF